MKTKAVTENQYMKTFPEEYIEKVYAGWLGKVIGVRHGSNIEQWTYQKIKDTYGEIDGYLFDFKNFAADDDTNGPIFFLRALEDYTYTREITPEQIGLTWLNYAGDEHGFYWWGGYGKSTENTAYLNLKSGIMAPRSGSIEQNGYAVAEQIGGQIFIDVWGLIAPNNPQLAAEYAEKAASVSHDGNGKYGGMFIAACIAAAFTEKDIKSVIQVGLSVIPSDCEYTTMTKDVIRFYEENPDNWEDAFQYVFQNYGYDRYPGACHIIPNSAVIVLSMLYGEGDFSKTINICNMCGWDTDCNVANVGTILGVLNGLSGIDLSWREPINDFLCCSSAIGSLNILDLPWCASFITKFGFKIAEIEPPSSWAGIINETGVKYHFEYPGSTHSFRAFGQDSNVTLENTDQLSYQGTRSLKVDFNKVKSGEAYRSYVQTYYRPEDFNDSRYDPSFSPILYPGQAISGFVLTNEEEVTARAYIRDRNSGKLYYGEAVSLVSGQWMEVEYQIPAMSDVCIIEAGIELLPNQSSEELTIYIDQFDFSGNPNYSIQFANEQMEKWHGLHLEVSQLSYLRGIWRLEDGELSGSYHAGAPAEAYTGDIKWRDYSFEAEIIPKLGDHHRINFRVQGGIRSYAVGLSEANEFVLYKNKNGYEVLATCSLDWEMDQAYKIKVDANGASFDIYVDGKLVLQYEDKDNPYLFGLVGFSNSGGSHTHYSGFSVSGIS